MKNFRFLTATLFAFSCLLPDLLWGQWERLTAPYHAEPRQLQAFDNQLFCTAPEGAFRSKDTGLTWEQLVASPGTYYNFLYFNPGNKHYYFIDEQNEIQKSVDEGKNWQSFGLMPVTTSTFQQERGLFFYGNDIYAFQQNYIAKKEAGGPLNGWTPIFTMPTGPDSSGFVFKVTVNGSDFWAETSMGIFVSSDLGLHWRLVFYGAPNNLALRGDTLLCAKNGSAPGGRRLYRSINRGATWDTLPAPGFDIDYVLSAGQHFYAGGLYASTTGTQWTLVTDVGMYSNYVTSVAELGNVVCLATVGVTTLPTGMLRSADKGATFYYSNQGLPNAGGIPVPRYLDGRLHLSDGLGYSEDDGASWQGTWQQVSPQEIVRAGNRYVGLYRLGGSTTLGPFICPANGRFEWRMPDLGANAVSFGRFTSVGDTMYGVSGTNILRSRDGGNTWVPTGTSPSPDFLLGGRGKLFSTQDTKVVYSTDEGATWQVAYDFGAPLNINTSRFFISGDTLLFSYPTTDRIYYSANQGFSFDTLPAPQDKNAAPYRLRMFKNTMALYTGDGNQVYISRNYGKSWLKIPLPSGVTLDMDLLGADNRYLVLPVKGAIWRIRYDGLRDVRGRVFLDTNANGLRDSGEPGVADRLLTASKSGLVGKTEANGAFSTTLATSADTLRVSNVPPNFAALPPFKVVAPNDTATVYFALQPQGNIRNVAVRWGIPTPFRAGFGNHVAAIIENNGTRNTSGTLRLSLPPHIRFESADPMPTRQYQDSVVWQIADFSPLQQLVFQLVLKTEPVPPGTPVSLELLANIALEKTPADNRAIYQGTVVASFDPNDKAVSPAYLPPALADGAPLHYTIRFQNLGNAATDFVVVRDTLPERLDVSRLRILSSSHPMTWRLFKGRILEFRFNPLALPPASLDDAGSRGFVQFSVPTRRGLMVGDAIDNMAHIYFDFNPAVTTNTARMEVKTVAVRAAPLRAKPLMVAPNPATDLVILQVPSVETRAGHLRLFDETGGLVFETPTGDRLYRLSVLRLPAGRYTALWQLGEDLFRGRIEVVR